MACKGDTGEPRVLFISRKFPPSVGGMERLSYELITNMRKRLKCSAITWGYSQKYLPFFIPIAFFRALFNLSSGEIDLIHIGDALLSPLGFVLKKISGRPVAVNLHGLDMTFPNRFYQWTMRAFLPRFDLYICISQYTRDIALERGLPAEKITVIPCGIQVSAEEDMRNGVHDRTYLETVLGKEIKGKRIALTVGRLVKRKGVRCFVGDILPDIVRQFPDLLYVVVGEGGETEGIEREAARANLENHVSLLGRVSSQELELLYRTSDLFVMPNILVDGDVEGFGIVILEASLAGLPVVAFAVEGITDAVTDGMNGILLKPGDNAAFAATMVDLLRDDRSRRELGERGRRFTEKTFSWRNLIEKYRDSFEACVRGAGKTGTLMSDNGVQ